MSDDIHSKVDAIIDKTNTILLILQGNGNPDKGLVMKHGLLAASVAACQKHHAENNKRNRHNWEFWVMAIIAAAAVLEKVFS